MRPPAVIVALLLAAAPAGADEVRSNVSFRTSFDSNQREVSDRFNEQSGYSASINPFMELSGERERLRYDLSYQPNVFYISEADPHDRINHRAAGNLSYQLGRLTALGASFTYRNTETLLRDREFDDVDGTELVLRRERRQRASLSLDLSRRWSRRLSTSLTAAHSIFRADTENIADASNSALSASLSYRINEDMAAGLNASVRQQSFEDTSARDGRSTRFLSLRATWNQELDERTTLSFSAGPLLVDTEDLDPIVGPETQIVHRFPTDVDADDSFFFDATSCPPVPGSGGSQFLLVRGECELLGSPIPEDREGLRNVLVRALFPSGQVLEREGEREVTLSASATLSRRWRHTTASLRFSRSEGSVDGFGTSTVRNTIDASLEWEPTRDWRLRFWGNWTQRDSTSEIERLVPVVGPATVPGVPSNAAEVLPLARIGFSRLGLLRPGVDANAADATFYTLRFGVWRRLARRWHVGTIIRYQDQKRESEFFATGRDFENMGISFVLTYRFPKFRPW